ncbi:RNA polymerase sigma factor [Salinivibrio sp. DV]|uniref:RNA polymerase sigma factor n=1 Tax=Salinivibrio sp. SS2 TaxID=1892894 RepID=UPI00352E19C9
MTNDTLFNIIISLRRTLIQRCQSTLSPQSSDLLGTYISHLSACDREILALTYLFHLSSNEIAMVCQLSESTVKRRLTMIRYRLHAAIHAHNKKQESSDVN